MQSHARLKRGVSDQVLEHIGPTMSAYSQAWWVAGGWAIDLHLGRQHRPHKDVDIAVLRIHQAELHSSFCGWSFQKVVNGVLEPWQPNEVLQLPIHEVHATRRAERLEFLLNETSGNRWIFRRDPSISMPLERVSRRSSESIPYLCPEIVLLYKAKAPRKYDTEDFERACTTLDAYAKRWLAAALNTCHPGHEWTSKL